MPGENKQLDPIKKDGLICVPNADVVRMKDREGNEMTTVVNTTPSSNQATNFIAPTRDGGYIGRSSTGASVERMIERIKSETGCEVRFHIEFNTDEELSKFEENAVEKRVLSNNDLPEAKPSEPKTNTNE